MYICEYGCNREALFQFKNGKLCCEENHKRCPSYKERHPAWNKGLKGEEYTKYYEQPINSGRTYGEPWNPKGSKAPAISKGRLIQLDSTGNADWWSVRLRQQYKECVLCKGSNDVMHHKDENRKNNARSNLIVICLLCHDFWHQGWTNYD